MIIADLFTEQQHMAEIDRMPSLVYKSTRQPVKVGDKVPGKRMGKFYAHVQAIHADCVELLYNGDVRNFKVAFDVIDAVIV